MRPKRFVIIFITYVYTIDIPTMGSHGDNMCFVFTQFVVIVLDCTISFSLWWTMVKMAIYTQKCKQKWLKINNRGGWNKDALGGKNGKINNRVGGRDDYLGLESTFPGLVAYKRVAYIQRSNTFLVGTVNNRLIWKKKTLLWKQ